MSLAAEASEHKNAIGDKTHTDRRPKPPKRTGSEMRRSKTSEIGPIKFSLDTKHSLTCKSNHEAAGCKTSGGTTRERKERRGTIEERRKM